MSRAFIQAMQSESATQAPVIAAVRVPPSAWITSQSMVIWRSPSACRSMTERSERPISRWISTVRPPCLPALGERQITVDCDVIQADGGTRTAAITGAWVALSDCIAWMKARDMLRGNPLRDHVAAVSCGVHKGVAVLDLDYAEDSDADTDANFVMTGAGNIVEVQATAEKVAFSEDQLTALIGLARKGIGKLVDLQKLAVM